MAANWNDAQFRTQFPQYADKLAFTPAYLLCNWNNATQYIERCGRGMRPGQLQLAMNYMTAHLTCLSQIANSGEQGGLVVGANIDKIGVTIQPPPQVNQWQTWLEQTIYGGNLLALLQVITVGGFYIGGYNPGLSLRFPGLRGY